MLDDVCVVVTNFQTIDLLEIAVESFRKFYPDVKMLIVDNGSKDQSRAAIRALAQKNPARVLTRFYERNIYHGPAMHAAALEREEPYLFYLDSDTQTMRGGFLERMVSVLNEDEKLYGVGRVDHVNKRGFSSAEGTPILISAYMMLRRKTYFELPSFKHHGMPTMDNFAAAAAKGYSLKHFEMDNYIRHYGRGTASRFGYGLGLRGKLNFLLNKVGL